MVDKTMSIGDVLRLDRNTAPIMMSYGMHCLGCPHATMESLEMACMAHGVNVDDLVAELNKYFEEKK